MLVLSTIELAFSSHFEQVAYIDFQGRFSGTPLVAQTVYTRKHIALSAVLLVASILLDMISLGVLVWRCWIIWRMTRYSFLVIILPLVLLIVRFALLIVVLARNLVPDLYPGVVMDILLLVTMGLDTTITMIVTTPIVRRLLIVRRRHIRIMGSASEHASPYYSIITMFVESYALESAWSLGSIISRATLEAGDPAILFFAPTGDSVKVIAYLLVAYRVSTGQAWTSETERQLSSLRWNRSQGTRTDEQGGRSQARAIRASITDNAPTNHTSA